MSDLRTIGTLIGMHERIFWYLAGAALCACGQAADLPHNLGNTDTEASIGHAPPPAQGGDFRGIWLGSIENPLAVTDDGGPSIYVFPSGSTEMRLVYTREEPHTITFGNRSGPPDINYETGYPPGRNYLRGDTALSSLLPPVEGFAYELQSYPNVTDQDSAAGPDESVPAGFIRFVYWQNEPLNEWCRGQVPQEIDEGEYACVGGKQISYSGDPDPYADAPGACKLQRYTPNVRERVPQEAVDCNRAFLCHFSVVPVCECSPRGCEGTRFAQVNLLLRPEGGELVGDFTQAVFLIEGRSLASLGTVRFRRE